MSIRASGYLGHILSWRFLLALLVVFAADHWLEHSHVVERAALGGFDAALEQSNPRPARRTAIVAITAEDVNRYFAGRRPIPAAGLDSVIRRLLGLNVDVLVIDVFTDDSSFKSTILADTVLLASQERLVWAQFADTASGEVLPAVGGVSDVPGRSGVATMTADVDHLVRRFRLRLIANGFGANADTLESLPYAAALALDARLKRNDEKILADRPSLHIARAPADTGSIGIRPYTRNPPFYVLDDVLSADPRQVAAAMSGRVIVLGFLDGSDQVLTPRGAQPGSRVVADAIETVIDDRRAIQSLPSWAELVAKIGLALLIAFIHYRLTTRAGAIVMICLAIMVVKASFLILEQTGIWTNYILIVLSIWIEQLYESVSSSPHRATSTVQPSFEEAEDAARGLALGSGILGSVDVDGG